MRKVKSIFTSPYFIVKFLKKSKVDNFLGGLVIGAIISLLVNIITVGVQERIQKQRVLEALESEILINGILANSIIKENEFQIQMEASPSAFHRVRKFSSKVWDSSEALHYLLELDPKVQGEIGAYYSAIIGGANDMIDTGKEITKAKLVDCYFDTDKLKSVELLRCRMWYENALKTEITASELVSKHTRDILIDFHPTRDRLNDPFMKSIMGDKAVGALTVPPK